MCIELDSNQYAVHAREVEGNIGVFATADSRAVAVAILHAGAMIAHAIEKASSGEDVNSERIPEELASMAKSIRKVAEAVNNTHPFGG